jgi:CBS domain-containing protein
VHDYAPGKMDWLAFDLPFEGEATLAGAAAVRDLPTCSEDEPVAALSDRLDGSPIGRVVVVNEPGVVLGVVTAKAARERPDARVADVLREGPTTVRPSEELDALRHRMDHAGTSAVLVTRQDGVLVGAVLADDAGDGHHGHDHG